MAVSCPDLWERCGPQQTAWATALSATLPMARGADAGLRGIGNVSPLLVPGVSEGPVCFGPPRLGLSSRSTCAVVPVRLCSAGLKLR